MAKTNIKRIAKLSFLITLKEAYFLSKNFLGLIYHPFLTLSTIKEKKDKSQTILISLALLTMFGLIPLIISLIFFLGSRIANFALLPYLNKIIFLDLYLIFLGIISFFYLAYWLIKVLTAQRSK